MTVMSVRSALKAGDAAAVPVRDTEPPWHGIPTATARRFHQICSARSTEVVGEFGLTSLQFGAMVHLSRITGTEGMEQNILADRVNVDRNTASLLVEQLVKLGVVVRQVDEADRRVRLLRLTAKGRKLYIRLRPAIDAVNEDILSPITPSERKLLMNLLIRVIEGNLSRDGRPLRRSRRIRSSDNSA
jgi:DNA-binding MarR family transcriptional regulator